MQQANEVKLEDYPPMVSPKQLGELTGMHPETVRRLCQSGQLPARKIGKQWFIDREEVLGR